MNDFPQSVLDLLADGRKIEAIKEVRALTGWDLRTAKDAVERVERNEFSSTSALPSSPSVAPDALATRIYDLVESGQTIQAIKEVRDATGAGLRDAKRIVDQVAAGQSLDDLSALSSRPLSPRKSAAPLLIALIGFILLVLLGVGLVFFTVA